MQTQEQILDGIVEIMNNYLNGYVKHGFHETTLNKIQTLLEENYIHGSLDNDYK